MLLTVSLYHLISYNNCVQQSAFGKEKKQSAFKIHKKLTIGSHSLVQVSPAHHCMWLLPTCRFPQYVNTAEFQAIA